MNWFKRKLEKELNNSVEEISDRIIRMLTSSTEEVRNIVCNLQERATLLKDIEKLKIEKGRKDEEFARREREIEHKVGLERARQEQELTLAKREAIVSVREDTLKAERERFEQNMKFMQDRFEKEVKYQRELSEELLKALPKMTIRQEIK